METNTKNDVFISQFICKRKEKRPNTQCNGVARACKSYGYANWICHMRNKIDIAYTCSEIKTCSIQVKWGVYTGIELWWWYSVTVSSYDIDKAGDQIR